MIQFYKKGELFNIKRNHFPNDVEMNDCENLDMEEELQDHESELRKFVNENV